MALDRVLRQGFVVPAAGFPETNMPDQSAREGVACWALAWFGLRVAASGALAIGVRGRRSGGSVSVLLAAGVAVDGFYARHQRRRS
ncbi:hypothetical protein HS99_0018365 [Kitasatospora aureofaciens]|uniref:Uncharacterized protein n=1 Tax=Kitasatospora aureofaciens TaxID=1894 RepID=A0A1E7NEG8_KITAU|nr:hypothetical protein B6264_30650 [Kitasatospora aureofaciens]OEV39062.1 hypothetical protein HS99_0018365 [Kitasatospora aureofaciens]GGV03836.1 hypothetical protein GCM10010502_68230 [Kitasatospora aureofaciens]